MLDIGGGSAHFKDYRADVVSLDIQAFRGIDVVADAHNLPFRSASFAGIVLLDVLHHLQKPCAFLREAARVLRPGGRLAMIEPGISYVSSFFYRHFHHEPVVMAADPYAEADLQSSDDPWDSNQAIPTLMFADADARTKLNIAVPDLSVRSVRWLSLGAYPLSGGFNRWCLLPSFAVRPLLRIEEGLLPVLGPLAGFRLLVVVERL
jgi:SAM-dependent methyltransferase